MSRQTCIFRMMLGLALVLSLTPFASAQQTLGGITGVITDAQGGILSGATVLATGDQTGLKRTQLSGDDGYYSFVNLPIGAYTLTVTHDGFQTEVFPAITVQADRTATLNATLTLGAASTSVTVTASPLMNAVDTTVGYVLDKAQIETVPLPTGSFTGLAILSPGVNAEFPGGTGANAASATPPSGPTVSATPSNSFSSMASTPATCSTARAPARWNRPASSTTPASQQRRRRHRAQRRLHLSLHRQFDPHACARDHRRGSGQLVDVRRRAGFHLGRPHRPQHQGRHQRVPRQRLLPPRH